MLTWMSTDGKLLLASRIVRAFGYGFLSVILAIYLKLLGFEEVRIGIILTATLLSGAAFTALASVAERKIGRRRMLMLFAALMSLAGVIFGITEEYVALLFAALIGTINVTGTEVGPFLSVEQAIIPQTSEERKRNFAFALFSTLGTLATSAGALLSGIPSILQKSFGFGIIDSFRPIFVLYVLVGVVTLILYGFLSNRVEVSVAPERLAKSKLLSPKSKRLVAKLSTLFALDSFAGGFVIQSIVAYWFFTKFSVPLSQVSLIFSAAGVLTAISFLAAAKIADKIGLVNTMVFTHIPSNILLIMVPLAPSLLLAMGFYLARMSLSQMDVPTRQSYTVAIVNPEERVSAAGFTNISRNVAQAVSPSISGYVLQFLSLSYPFFIGGSLKVVYDLLLYSSFRSTKPVEELRVRHGVP